VPSPLQPAGSLKSDFRGRNNVTTGTTSELTDTITVCSLDELPEGAMRLVEAEDWRKI
jgi:hypothetical protein